MGFGLPVIATNATPIKRILKTENCGISYKSGDADEFTKAIVKIHKSADKYGEKGKRAVLDEYNWENEEKKLLRMVDSFGI